jgi:HTH-type transcriptional regulator/antitoxin HigA
MPERMNIQKSDITDITEAWSSLAAKVYVPCSDEGYERLVMLLDVLINEVGEEETHPLTSLMEIVGVLIEKYEEERVLELDN